MIQEFHVSITAVGKERYLLRTEAVAPGVPLAETQVDWPVEAWLEQAAALAQDPLQALLTTPSAEAALYGSSYGGRSSDAPWMQLGQSLYQHIFRDRIRDSWLAAQGVAHNRRQTLRLRLGLKESRLQRLPWEVLYGDDRPLATGNDVTLCRYYQAPNAVDLAAMPPLPARDEPIRVLVVISAPDDQERLALRREVQEVMRELERGTQQTAKPAMGGITTGAVPGPVRLQLTILEQPGRPELVQALEQGQFQVLHYAGHSDVSETGGDLFLVNRQTGLTDWLSGEDLAGLLVNNGIRLAIFNSCRGAFTAQDDASAGWREQNLVQALVNRGVPGVIAMAERIPDDVAVSFTQLMYRNLHQGYPIDLCLSRVRQGLLSGYRSDKPFWMLPILYLRPEFDGYLYRQDESSTESADLLEDDVPDSDGSLTPPDYSADPDIYNLAQEVFAGHQVKANAFLVDRQPNHEPGDWVSELEAENDAELAADTATMHNLVQQLSHPQPQSTGVTEPTLKAPANENLLPQWEATHPPALGQPPGTGVSGQPSSGQPASSPDVTRSESESGHFSASGASQGTDAESSKFWQKPFTIPLNLLIWGMVGIVGVAASLFLAVLILTRDTTNVDQPIGIITPTTPDVGSDGATADDSAVIVRNAVAALTVNNTTAAQFFIEQLLDLGAFEAAQSAIATAAPNQLLNTDIAFVRGRLMWQQVARGDTTGSLHDARRYWTDAVDAQDDNLEAWVALGFANYALADYDQAIDAWEKAVALDRASLRDADPLTQQRVSTKFAINAYAGLAMAYQKLSELELSTRERSQLQTKAQDYFELVIRLAPEMLNPQQLALDWLWTPELINDWQVATARLSVGGVLDSIQEP